MSSEDERLPGEFSRDEQAAAVESWVMHMFEGLVPGWEDGYLDRTLAILHAEWERRHGERWVVQ